MLCDFSQLWVTMADVCDLIVAIPGDFFSVLAMLDQCRRVWTLSVFVRLRVFAPLFGHLRPHAWQAGR